MALLVVDVIAKPSYRVWKEYKVGILLKVDYKGKRDLIINKNGVYVHFSTDPIMMQEYWPNLKKLKYWLHKAGIYV